MTWYKHKDVLYNLDNGTMVDKITDTGGMSYVRIKTQVESGPRSTFMDCADAEEAETLFKDICCKLLPGNYH